MSKKVDPRVIRTRKMFEEALLDLMEEKEYQSITVQEIAKRSTLNRATFYLHYFDKDDLLEQLLDVAIENLSENLKLHDHEFKYGSDYAHPTLVRLFEKIMTNDRFYKLMLVDEKIPYFTESVKEIIERLVREGTNYMLDDDIDYKVPVEISIAYITAAYLGVVIWWLDNGMPYTPTYMATQLTTMSTVGPFVKNPYLG